MATIQVTGTLELPMTEASSQTKIRFTCSSGMLSVLKTATQTISTGTDGSYDFNLNEGMYVIEAMYGGHWNYLGNVNITSSVPSPSTLNDLLATYSVPLPDDVQEFTTYNVLSPKGDFNASAGNFPSDPMYPTKIADTWRITTAGTLTNDTYTLEVEVNDIIYWSIVNQRWFRWGSEHTDIDLSTATFDVDQINLTEGQLLHGTLAGRAEATTMATLLAGQIIIHTFDGTSNSVTVAHNKNRKVFPIMFATDGTIVAPTYTESDADNLLVEAADNLTGTLIIL